MCGIAVEKAKGLGGIVIRTGDYAEAFINGSMKKCYEKFRKTYNKNSVPESLFLIKLDAVDLQLHLKPRLQYNDEHHKMTAADYSSINSSEGGIGK